MWPWIKRWRDWTMHDLWPLYRIRPQSQSLHFSYEKAGLTLHDTAIPWNAEAVLVEALLRLPAAAAQHKGDFVLSLPGAPPRPAESLRRQEGDSRYRVSFRIPPPAATATAQLVWRKSPLGQVTIPVLGRDEFLQGLRLQLPTLFVRLGDDSVACQTFVSSQCRGLLATGVLTSAPCSLVPLVDLEMQVELRCETTGACHVTPVRVSTSQLGARQALLSVLPRKFPRRIGTWLVNWTVGGQALASLRVRAISQRQFLRSLRVVDTRFVLQTAEHGLRVARQVPPLEGLQRVGPVFLVSSREPGMAGLCPMQVRAQLPGAIQPPLLLDHQVLISDGPTMLAPGTMEVSDLTNVTAFELGMKGQSPFLLSMRPAPTAAFNTEGAFRPPQDFTWTAAADEELNERLNRLLESRAKGE